MKHLIKDNKIIQSGIPSHFTRSDGQSFWGGYENMTDLHFEDGWREEIIPEYNSETQTLGVRYYDITNDVVTYTLNDIIVEEKIIDLEAEKARLNNDLSNLKKELAILAMQAKLTYDIEPPELTEILTLIRGLNSVAKAEIEALTEADVLDYTLRGPQVQQLIQILNSFL